MTCKADAKPSDVRHLFVPVISAMDIDEKVFMIIFLLIIGY